MCESPSNLLETLKQAQENILSALEEVYQASRSYLVARQALPALEEKILTHLRFQEEEVMRPLELFYRDDRENSKKMEFLRYESKELTVKVLTFGDKYFHNTNSVAARRFPRDFSELRQAVVDRIQVEVEYLFPMYEEYLKNKRQGVKKK